MVDPSVPAHINKALSVTNASIPASPGKMLHSMLKNIAPTLIIKCDNANIILWQEILFEQVIFGNVHVNNKQHYAYLYIIAMV